MAKAELEIVVRGKTPEAWAAYDAVIEAAPSVAELLERVEMEHGERTGAADPFCEAVRALAELEEK